ncbi:MAG TPA: C40 family peptidase [Candidatus Ornithomonoglobus merdipullorum]|uniref:C40 family peptidase n=1 Tax=Candidatus Ornithomonoglobus merdipullorum TaxID=2840895 RepID=A0A9D1MD48_9FIRM|nr:C40 family peptidase [Candidatus Ornithomonoglobus merdipullorum]
MRRSARAAKAAGRAAVHLAVKAAQAIAAAAKNVVSAIAALGGWAVLLVVLIVITIIAAIAASPFGIFISEEVNETGSIPLSQIISEYNIELTQEVEDIELSVEHTEAEIIDNRTDNNVVIAVFAAKIAGAEDDTAEDVVVFDEAKAERLKDYFRTANAVEFTTFEVSDGETTGLKLAITIRGKTKEELMDEYGLTAKQREAVETLLEHGDVITSSSHSLAITDADVRSIIEGLPDSLPQKRKDVVKNTGSLVGKVNYFWGGKSSAIGWDPVWGTMHRVTAEGSPSSGTLRAYGLDCSGFVSWVFLNSGMSGVGDGTIGQRDRSRRVSESSVQAGDLAFLPSYSHVGIVVGKDTDGNILVIHCSSSANNVVVSTAQSVGFTVFRRPNCY